MLGVVACVRNPSTVMARWDVGCTGQLTKEPCEEGENPYSDLSFEAHLGVVVHTRVCVCMYLLFLYLHHIYTRGVKMNKTVNRKEDLIFFLFFTIVTFCKCFLRGVVNSTG